MYLFVFYKKWLKLIMILKILKEINNLFEWNWNIYWVYVCLIIYKNINYLIFFGNNNEIRF